MGLRLLPKAALVQTGDVDHADWNYDRGALGFVSRRRFDLVLSLLPKRCENLLELGYGSGIFMPDLARRADRVFGVDVHERSEDVGAALKANGVTASLSTAPAERLPFADHTFDAVVVVSTFEFVTDLDQSIREVVRVLRPSGCAIVVTPQENALLDLALRFFTSESAEKDFGDRRKAIVPALLRGMRHDRSAWFPARGPIPIYRALRLLPPGP